MFLVYKAYSTVTHWCYYGYCEADSPDLVAKNFITQSSRPDQDRGDVRFLTECGSIDHIQFDIVKQTDDELDAYIERNAMRTKDPSSITGPTIWPVHLHRTAVEESKQTTDGWNREIACRSAPNALVAYQSHAAFQFQDIKLLCEMYGQELIKAHLSNLSYQQFKSKYKQELLHDKN